MKQFKDLGIKPAIKHLQGDKIKIMKILNREIIVVDYKIEDSKYEGKVLYMQIKVGDEMRVVFTGSKNLIEMIKRVAISDFPFTTTIVKEDERFQFT